MKIIFTKLFTLALVFLLQSCGKENSDVFTPSGVITGADTIWITGNTSHSAIQDLKRQLAILPKVDSCEISSTAILQFPDGLQITIPANSLRFANGQAVTGKIYAEAFSTRKKGEMVRLDKPTTSYGRQLISAGEIFIQFKKNGDELVLVPGKKIGLRYSEVTNNSRLFKGDETDPENFTWKESQDTIAFGLQGSIHCEINSSQLRWSGLHSFADTSGVRVNLHVSLPVNYTNANTSVYLVYKDVKSVIGIYGNAAMKKFISIKLPIGKQATIVVLSKQGPNSFYLGQQQIVTGLNTPATAMQVSIVHPQPISLTDIKSFLESLN